MTARFFRGAMRWADYAAFAEGLEPPAGTEPPEPKYNIAPGSWIPVLRLAPFGARRIELALMLWGLVPQWWREPLSEKRWSSFNARIEDIEESPTFRGAVRYRRCLVPASGFFVWSGPDGRRVPFAVALADRAPFCFAGIWECWGHDGSEIDTVAILTTEANAAMAAHGARMPVILHSDTARRWIGGGVPVPNNLLTPPPEGVLTEWPVDPAIGNVRNQGPQLLREP